MDAAELSTSVTITRGVLAELRVVKAEMSRQALRPVHYPEVITKLIACWREQYKRIAAPDADPRKMQGG